MNVRVLLLTSQTKDVDTLGCEQPPHAFRDLEDESLQFQVLLLLEITRYLLTVELRCD